MKVYSKATLSDVPEIVNLILALRELTRRSKVQTGKTQSVILRTISSAVLCEVALKLQEAEAR